MRFSSTGFIYRADARQINCYSFDNTMNNKDTNNEWEQWWNARVAAMKSLYGEMDSNVGHSPIPFDMGAEIGGGADVVYFKNFVPGIVAVTSELIGRNDQQPNELGNYELAICTRVEEPWAPSLISRLAHYTLEATLSPGETMDIGPALPEGSTIGAFLFVDFGRFKVMGREAGVLLCLGITSEELDACHAGHREQVESALRSNSIYPFTDLKRGSVALPKTKKSWWKQWGLRDTHKMNGQSE